MSIGSIIGMNVTSIVLNNALTNASKQPGLTPENKIQLFQTTGIKSADNPQFERFSRNYINSEPELLFVAEYMIDGKSIGALLVWERFFDSTHYEVFKKNLFKEDAKMERILFLDSQSLEEETANYVDYLKNTIGLDIEADKIYVVLDTMVKEDRIYEYKLRASRVPKRSTEVDYDFILESKDLTKQIVVDQNNKSNVFDFAGSILGSNDLAWIISLLNENVVFFGKNGVEKTLVSYNLPRNSDQEEYVLVANDLNNIVTIFNESTSLFQIVDTFDHLLGVLGGLGSDFKTSAKESVDQTRVLFSYDNFRASIVKKVPVFSLTLKIAQSNNPGAVAELSKLSISIPKNTGTESFSTIESLTKIVKFINDTYLACLYSQDNSEKIKEILANMDKPQTTDTVSQSSAQTTVSNTTGNVQDSTNSVTSNGSNAKVSVSTPNAGANTSNGKVKVI